MVTDRKKMSASGRVRRGRDRTDALKRWFRDSPLLIGSLLFHLLILLLLCFMSVHQAREVRQRIRVRVDALADDEEEIPIEPFITPDLLSTDPSAASGTLDRFGEDADDGNEGRWAEGERVPSDPAPFGSIHHPVRPGSPTQWEERVDPEGSWNLAPEDHVHGLPGAVDQFAVVTMNAARRGKTLIVLLIDRTRSVVYLNLPQLVDRMDHYFETLRLNLTQEMHNNARWVVVGYGQDTVFYTLPVDDLEHLKSALRSVEICRDGIQNLGAALHTVLDQYGGDHYRQMLVATMTDGYGSDLRDGAFLERTIKRLRDNRASLFVFGHEAAFAANRKHKSLLLDPERLQPADREDIRGFEGQTITGWVDAGPESPRRELWGGHRAWGWDDRDLPASGFGMYALNRMVLATGGLYFLLERESDFDSVKLYSLYAPDMCSRYEYDRRMRTEPLRAALREIWDEIPTMYGLRRHYTLFRVTEDGVRDLSGRVDARITEDLGQVISHRQMALRRIEQLRELIDRPDVRAMSHYMRWRAHAHLTMAELKRQRFMLGQTAEALRRFRDDYRRHDFPQYLRREAERTGVRFRFFERGPGELVGYHWSFGLGRGSAPDDFLGPRAAAQEYESARQFIRGAMEEHVDTPWEPMLRRILNGLHPWQPRIGEHAPPSGVGRPPAPQLGPMPL